ASFEIVQKRRLRRHLRQPRTVVPQLMLAVLNREVGTDAGCTELAVRHIEQRRFRNEYIELIAHLPLKGICALVQRCILSHGLILLIESPDYRAFCKLYSRTNARATHKAARTGANLPRKEL